VCHTGLPESASPELTASLVEAGLRALRDGKLPQVVEVPEDVAMADAESAFALCRRLGVLNESGNGWLLVPKGVWSLEYRS